MTDFDSDRRKLLKAGGAGMAIALAGCIGPFQDSQGVPGTVERAEPDDDADDTQDDDWFDEVPNYDGETEDLTGEDDVEVLNGDGDEIGVEGTFVFEPADIQIDPGTTVQWTWVGSDSHSVTHEPDNGEELFDSGTFGGDGETFEHTFEDEGVYDYYCIPHRAMGQKGRVRVGDAEAEDGGDVETQIEEYLADTPNWDGEIEDLTGEDDIVIENGDGDEIGVEGTFVFEPPAITIDAGTTVTWEWVGDDSHSVTHEDEEFDSETFGGDGETFEYTFEESGLYLYYCIPHRAMGQRGAVVVEE